MAMVLIDQWCLCGHVVGSCDLWLGHVTCGWVIPNYVMSLNCVVLMPYS